jgi:ribose transport system permease protein
MVSKFQLELRMFVVMIGLGTLLAISSPNFLSSGNVYNLMDQCVIVGLVAIGQTFVILIAGIDLSVGAITAVAGVILGTLLTQAHVPLPVAIVVGVITGALIGLLNGLLITQFKLAAFIVTLGMMSIGRSIAQVITDGSSISDLPDAYGELVNFSVMGIPATFIFLIAMFALAWYYLNYTKGGRTIYAIGSNIEAARAAGLKVGFYSVLAYALAGALSAIAAVLLGARIMSIDPLAGTGLELDSIAAVVIGGASLFGGRGSMIGTLFGVLIMVFIRNGLNLMGVGPYWQGTAIGAVILIAVLIERIISSRFDTHSN